MAIFPGKRGIMPGPYSLSKWFRLIRTLNKKPITVNELDLESEIQISSLYRHMRTLYEMGIIQKMGVKHNPKKPNPNWTGVNTTTETVWGLTWVGRGLIRYIREMKL